MESLQERERVIRRQIQDLQKELEMIHQAKIIYLAQNGVRCASCQRYRLQKDVWIATQDDADSYIDENEGYAPPEIGEWYCGCS